MKRVTPRRCSRENTERSGFLSANDEKRPTGSTARTPFAKWGRAGVDSLPDLLSSDRSAGWVSESTCRRGNFMCTRRTAPSVASPLLHGIKRSAFTQERERFGCARSVARYIYRSTWEHARAQYIIREVKLRGAPAASDTT